MSSKITAPTFGVFAWNDRLCACLKCRAVMIALDAQGSNNIDPSLRDRRELWRHDQSLTFAPLSSVLGCNHVCASRR
jgi:hypothetical protein